VTEAILLAIIGGSVSIVLALIGFANLVWTKRLEQKINSRMDELLQLTRESSRALGVKEEKDRNA